MERAGCAGGDEPSGPGVGRMPRDVRRAAAERREARRWAIPPAISGDPEIGPTARRATGAAFRTSACRRSAPLIFWRERKRDEGAPGALLNGSAERWLLARPLLRNPEKIQYQQRRGQHGQVID